MVSILGGLSVYLFSQSQELNTYTQSNVLGLETTFKNTTSQIQQDPNLCTSFTYSSWGLCKNGVQTRELISSFPEGCTQGTPELSRSCEETKVVCGMMDENGNGKIDMYDYEQFQKVFNKQCSDKPLDIGCGRKDVNGDGQINTEDLIIFTKLFGQPSCLR